MSTVEIPPTPREGDLLEMLIQSLADPSHAAFAAELKARRGR